MNQRTHEVVLEQEQSRNPGELLAFLTIVLAILGMFFSSPQFAGPDENHHQGTAWFLADNVLPPRVETQGQVPATIPERPCFAFSPEADTNCLPPRGVEGTSSVRILNYPPVYYWIVAPGQRIVNAIDGAWIDVGGRVASLLANLVILALLARLLIRSTRTWGSYLLLVATPMAVFLWAVVNPSGWEITTGLLFAYLLSVTWWGSERVTPNPPRTKELVGLGIAGLLFGLSRHDAFVWMILLIAAAALTGGASASRARTVRVLFASGLGVIAGGLWNLFFRAQHVLANESPVENPGVSDYVVWLGQIDNVMADRVRQMLGVLGWLDTPMPQWLMFLLLAGWAMLIGVLFARGKLPARVVVFGFAVSMLLPMVIELMRWNDWPYWYQGRITLPFTLAFLLLILVRYGGSAPRAVQAMSIVMGMALAVMVWQNLMRNSFGIRGYLPLRWSDPALGDFEYWISWACIAGILTISTVRIWQLARRRRIDYSASSLEAA